jgi:hypothetical protein
MPPAMVPSPSVGVGVNPIVTVGGGVLVGVFVYPIVTVGIWVVACIFVGWMDVGETDEMVGVCSADCVNANNVAATFVATRSASAVGFASGRLHPAKRIARNIAGPSLGFIGFIGFYSSIFFEVVQGSSSLETTLSCLQ